MYVIHNRSKYLTDSFYTENTLITKHCLVVCCVSFNLNLVFTCFPTCIPGFLHIFRGIIRKLSQCTGILVTVSTFACLLRLNLILNNISCSRILILHALKLFTGLLR